MVLYSDSKKYFIFLVLFATLFLIPKSSSGDIFSLDPCQSKVDIIEDGSNFYMNSKCFNITFPKDYTSDISFYDSYNDDTFDLKLFSLIDQNADNLPQQIPVTFASMSLTATKQENIVIYTSGDGKVRLKYTIQNGKVKAGIEIDDWKSNWATGNLILRTRIHKEDTALSHFINYPAIVDGVIYPLDVVEEIHGVNKFYKQTMFTGNNFTFLEIDPLYQVDYSPIPAKWLIGGILPSTPDSNFENITPITAGVSDNDTLTNYITKFETPTFSMNMGEQLIQDNTTSTSYVNRLDYNFSITETGTYLILVTAELHYNAIDRLIYAKAHINNEWIAEQQWIPKEPLITGDYQPFVTHTVKNLSTGSHNIKVDYKVEDAGDFGYIRNVRASTLKLGNYWTAYDNTSYDTGTTPQDLVSLIFTPSATKDYLVMATGDYRSGDKDISIYTQYVIDDVIIDDLNYESMRDDRLDFRPSYYFSQVNFDNTQHNVTIRGYEEGAMTSDFRNNRITIIELNNFDVLEDGTEHHSTSTSYRNVSNMTLELAESTEYLFLAYAQIESESVSDSVDTRFIIDGVQYCQNIFENKEITDPDDDMPFPCQVKINLSAGNHTSNIQFRSVAGANVIVTNLRLFAMPVNLSEFDEKARAISGEWNQTYNSSFDWYLVLSKPPTDYATSIYIHAYNNDDNVSIMNVTSYITPSQGTYIYNVSSLIEYMTINQSMNHTMLRIYTELETNISEIKLLKIAEDNTTPTISNCNINTTYVACNQTVVLSCTVTDDIGVGNVYYMVNGTNYTTSILGSNYSYTFSPTGDANPNNITYDWEYVFAYDLVNNLDTTDPNLQFDYQCCIPDWITQYTSCLTNDSQMKYYTDNNSCGNAIGIPVDNGTYTACNYCSEDIQPTGYSECYWNGTQGRKNFSYIDNNYFGCCVVTAQPSDCSILFSPYNESGQENCTFLISDFELELDLELYFGFGFGGLASDKVFGKIYINDSNTTYKCLSYVSTTDTGQVVQVNPPYTKRTTGVFQFWGREIEDREYFQTQNGLSNIYWTDNNLVIDGRNYKFGVECSSATGQHLYSEKTATVEHEPLNSPITRLFWFKDNTTSLILVLIVVIFLLLFAGWGVLVLKGRR